MEIKITYNGDRLVIQGLVKPSEPESGLLGEYFDIDEIKCNDVIVYDNYDFVQLDEIENICIKEVKGIDQSGWESVNV